MTVTLSVALVLTIVGFLVLLDRRDARDRVERQILLQRIQAPEAAVYEHATRDVAPDGDGMPLSDELLAEQEERARALAFIEQYEVS